MSRLAGRSIPDVEIRFDGRTLPARSGESLAAALLGADVGVVARSIYLGRPRGVFTAGPEEPNAIVHVTRPDGASATVPATTIEAAAGLEVTSLAGRAPLDPRRAGERHDKTYAHCDVVVVGAGPAGLAAAREAAAAGAWVTLVDERPAVGGRLEAENATVAGDSGAAWAAGVAVELAGQERVRILTRTTAAGLFGGGHVLAAERRGPDGWPAPGRLWHLRTRQVILATGACERPLVFRDNDRPGIMLAGAVREYVNRFGVVPGSRVVVWTTDDAAYAAAADLVDAGVHVECVIDARPGAGEAALALASERGVRVELGAVVVAAEGEERVSAVRVRAGDGAGDTIACDTLAVSGGWIPALGLYGQAGGRLAYDPGLACHVPAGPHPEILVAGAAAGEGTVEAAVRGGAAAGRAAAARLGLVADEGTAPQVAEGPGVAPTGSVWLVREGDEDLSSHFVDLQRDATAADVARALGAGLRSPEHVKRYTTIGTGSDQGRTSNLNLLGVMAELAGTPIADLAPTTARSPVVPLSFGLVAGRARGRLMDPERITPMHDWHVEHGAVFEDVGQWRRPWYYPRAGETMDQAVERECLAVREGVGMMDASTLGKIDVQGPDAGEFLDRIYTNVISTLAPGACRYGLMCGVDGMVLDDGVVMRLAPDRFVATTTTGNAALVLDWMEEWLQTEWPELRVRLTSVTEQWGVAAVAGPRSRDVVRRVADPAVVDAMAFMELRETEIAGVPGRIARVSFSGELAYELHVPGVYAQAMWERVWEAGADLGITAYGTEAMHVLRAEKGFIIVGQETDGTVTPQDLGMDWIVSKRKPFFVGRRSQRMPALTRPDRRRLVGLLPEDPQLRLPEGAAVVVPRDDGGGLRPAGHVTSSYRSPALGRTFALALVERGPELEGSSIEVVVDDRPCRARVTGTVFYDPEGRRRDG